MFSLVNVKLFKVGIGQWVRFSFTLKRLSTLNFLSFLGMTRKRESVGMCLKRSSFVMSSILFFFYLCQSIQRISNNSNNKNFILEQVCFF